MADTEVPKGCESGEWRVIGQEQDGALLLCWMSAETLYTEIGVFDSDNDSYTVLYKFDSVRNVIQASVNLNRTLVVFSVNEKEDEANCNEKEIEDEANSDEKEKEDNNFYNLFLARVNDNNRAVKIHATKQKQVLAQFYWRKKSPDKFLVLAHQEAIQIFQVEGSDEVTEAATDLKVSAVETIVKAFAWGQWDAIHQSLYFIHYRKRIHRVEGETQPDETELAPTLSALQFHEDMPHETVLNIPLNLPGMEGTKNEAVCSTYENDAVPLRIHDCSLDVTVVSDAKGILCICHHYLYQPVKPPTTEVMDESNTVHFAYSVTLLHHGHVIHCNIPGIPFSQASTLRPTFTMYNDQHLLVYCPDVFIHMLDIGQNHEPSCHILIGNDQLASNQLASSRLVSLLHSPAGGNRDADEQLLLNLCSLDVVKLKVTNRQLIDAYKRRDALLENKLSILHYFLIHAAEPGIVAEDIAENTVQHQEIHPLCNEMESENMPVTPLTSMGGGGGGGGSSQEGSGSSSRSLRNSKTYFYSTFIAYILGLVMTMFVMHVFKHAQPALLYLVPACLGTPMIVAILKGDLTAMFQYEDHQSEEQSVKEPSNSEITSTPAKKIPLKVKKDK